MLKRDTAFSVTLCKPTPGGEIELVRLFELRQIAFKARALGEEPKDTALVQHADMILPDHVVDCGEPRAVADQDWCETGKPVFHGAT